MKHHPDSWKWGTGRSSGSVLVMALLMAGILGFVMASYLTMASQQLKDSNRKYYEGVAQAKMEKGLETGLLALNHYKFPDSTSANQHVTPDGTWTLDASKRLATLVKGPENLSGGRKSWTTIQIDNYFLDRQAGMKATVTSETVIKDAQGNLVSRRRATVDLEPRNFFAHGLTSGGAVQGWYGDITFNSFVPKVGYSYGQKDSNGNYQYEVRDQGSFAANQVAAGFGTNFQIQGKLMTATGGASLGSSGFLQDFLTENPEVNKIDSRLLYDGFFANFPAIVAPGLERFSFPGTWSEETFGLNQDKHYQTTKKKFGYEIVPDEGYTFVHVPSGKTWFVEKEVEIVVRGGLRVDGKIVVKPGAQLTLYVDGAVQVTGSGDLENLTGDPSRLVMLASGQHNFSSWSVQNNSDLHAAIFAPRSFMTLVNHTSFGGVGTGRIYGAVIGNGFNFWGPHRIYVDERLFQNIIQNTTSLDRYFTFTPTSWNEEHPGDYLAGDPSGG